MKRIFSLLLVLVFCLGVVPSPGLADDLEEETPAALFSFINLSAAGEHGVSSWVHGEWTLERDALLDANPEIDQHGAEMSKTRLMLRAGVLDDPSSDPQAYFVMKDDAAWHELSLYGYEKLDPALITLNGAAVSSEGFEEFIFGDGVDVPNAIFYRYTARVTLPAEDGSIDICYDGETVNSLSLFHVDGISPVPLVSTLWVEDYEEDILEGDEGQLSIIRSMTLRISGFSLPDSAESYVLTWQNRDDYENPYTMSASEVTEPDACGYRLVTFSFYDGVEGNELMWCDLRLGEVAAYYFGRDEHLEGNAEDGYIFRRAYAYDDDPYFYLNGSFASIPTPYYCINKPAPVQGEAPEVMPELVILCRERGDGMLVTELTHVDVFQNPGSYLGGEFRLFTNDRRWPEWYYAGDSQNKIQLTFANKGEYGNYTLYAQFRKDGLKTVTVSGTLNYNDGTAPLPENPRILDAGSLMQVTPDGEGRLILSGAADKAYTFVADGFPEMTVNLYFQYYDEEHDCWYQTGTVIPMPYQEDTERYEVTLKKSEIPEDASAVVFWTEEAAGYLRNSEEVKLPILNLEPTLFLPMAPTYPAQRLIDGEGLFYEALKPGDEIECLFTASSGPGWAREAALTYVTLEGEDRVLTGEPVQYGKNSYRTVFAVPEDALQLVSLSCALLTGGLVAESAEYDLTSCRVTADVTLSGLPESYRGVRLTLMKGEFTRTCVLSGETSLDLGDLAPGEYEWELEGKSGHIAGGSFNVTRGAALTMPELPALGSLTVNTAGFTSSVNGETVKPEASAVITLKTPDGVTETITAAPGVKREELPVGTTGTVSLTWDASAYEEVSGCTPDSAEFTVSGDEELSFTFRPFTFRTISGRLYAQRQGTGHYYTPWGTVIVLTQTIDRGGRTETYTKTASISSATGTNWSFQCYDGFPATLEFRSLTWSGDPVTVTEDGDQNLGQILLTDGGEKLIQVKVEAQLPRFLNADGTPRSGANAAPVPLDSSFLEIRSVYTGSTSYGKEYFETYSVDGQLWLKLKKGVVAGNDVIDVNANGTIDYGDLTFRVRGDRYVWDDQTRRVKDLGNGTGVLTYTAAMNGGEIRATVVDDPDSGMTGFLMRFEKYSTGTVVCTYVCGTGELHLPYTGTTQGIYTVMSLMVRNEDVPAMAEVLRATPETILNQIPADKLEKYFMQNSNTKKYCFNENVYLQSNAYVYLDGMTPNVNVGSDILPPYAFSYDVSLTDDAATVLVTGKLTKRFPDVIRGDAVRLLNVYVSDAEGNLTADATDSVTVNGRNGYQGLFSYTYHDDVIQFKAPLSNYNELKFKVVLEIGNTGTSYGAREITFTYNDTIPIFSLSGPTNVYIADQLDAQGLKTKKAEYQAGWTLRMALRSFGSKVTEEQLITVWDNGVAVWKDYVGSYSYYRPINVRLTDNLKPGIHVLWATRRYNGETISTEPVVINLMNGSENNAVHVSDLTWVHFNHRTETSDAYGDIMRFKNLSDLAGQTIWLWPGKRTDMSFRVNNATTKELKGVSVRFYGVRVRGRFLDNITATIPCACVYENIAGNYSEWEFKNASMGYFYTFEFVFDYQPAVLSELSHQASDEERRVADLEASYEACGLGEVPDDTQAVNALQTLTKEQLQESLGSGRDYLPDALTGLSFRVAENTADRYEVSLAAPTDSIRDYRLSITAGPEVASHEIYALMEKERAEGSQDPEEAGWQVCWAELDGRQGSTLVRMAVQNVKLPNGTYALTMHRTVYLTAEVAEAIETGTSIEAAAAARAARGADAALMEDGLYDGGDPPAHWTKQTYDVVSYVNSAGDIAQDIYVAAVKDTYSNAAEALEAGEAAKFMPKRLGDAMNILGVADAAISISSGPSGKDSMGLYMLLSNVKDESFRASIEQQLRDYDQMRMDIYAQDTAMSSISAGAAFVPDPTPLTKIVTFIGGIGNSIISGWAKDYNREVYNTTLLDIQRQIRFEKYKEERKAFLEEMDKKFKEMVARRFGEDVANNERLLREEKKYWVLSTDEFGDPKWRLRENVPEYNTYEDPSGYVFEAVEENRLDGVTATLYFSETIDGTYAVWQDPAAEPQRNPQDTTEEGRYQWMVPEGWWKVRYEKEGYQTTESIPMQVPPAHTAVNIGLLSTEAPTAAVRETDGCWTVLFSKYMQLESLIRKAPDYGADEFDAAAFSVRFLDENGDPVPGTVTFPDKVRNTGYKGDAYGTDVIPSDWFVRTAVFTPLEGYTVDRYALGKGMVSYSGVALTQETEDLFLVRFDKAGGELTVESMVTDASGRLSRLPEPCREGYGFRGWYDEDGQSVTLDSVFSEDAVLTAQWAVSAEGYSIEAQQPEDGVLTVTFTNGTSETEPVTCVAAVYDANGRMLLSQTVSLTAGSAVLTPSTDGGAYLHAFCYDANGTPLTGMLYLKLETEE